MKTHLLCLGSMRAWCGRLRDLMLGRHVRDLWLLRQPARCGARRLFDLRLWLHARPARRGRRHFRACTGTVIFKRLPSQQLHPMHGTCKIASVKSHGRHAQPFR